MLRMLCLSAILVPVAVQAQQPKLLAECTNFEGYAYYFPNVLQTSMKGWDSSDLAGVTIGLFENTGDEVEPFTKYTVMYYKDVQGWHTPGPYLATLTLSENAPNFTVAVLYADNTTELYMFLLDKGRVAVNLMRHSGILENTRLLVGDCERP